MTKRRQAVRMAVQKVSQEQEPVADALVFGFPLPGVREDALQVGAQGLAAGSELLTPAPVLDGLLRGKSDQDAEHDDRDLADKLAPAVQRLR